MPHTHTTQHTHAHTTHTHHTHITYTSHTPHTHIQTHTTQTHTTHTHHIHTTHTTHTHTHPPTHSSRTKTVYEIHVQQNTKSSTLQISYRIKNPNNYFQQSITGMLQSDHTTVSLCYIMVLLRLSNNCYYHLHVFRGFCLLQWPKQLLLAGL